MTFAKGQSGNPRGRPRKGLALSDALKAALAAKGEDGLPARKKVVQALVDKAILGDLEAIRMVFERSDGKVADALNVNQSGKLVVEVVRVAGRAKSKD